MRSIFALVAEGVLRDATTNLVSIFNILETISASGFPVLIQKVQAVALWERESDEPAQRTGRIIVRLDDAEILQSPIQLNFEGKARNRSFVTIGGLTVPRPGSLRFVFEVDDGPTAEYTISVTSVEPKVEVETEPAGDAAQEV